MSDTDEVQAASDEPVIPGWIGPDTRTVHRRHKPWYKRRDVRRIIGIGVLMLVVIILVVGLLFSGR